MISFIRCDFRGLENRPTPGGKGRGHLETVMNLQIIPVSRNLLCEVIYEKNKLYDLLAFGKCYSFKKNHDIFTCTLEEELFSGFIQNVKDRQSLIIERRAETRALFFFFVDNSMF